MEPTLLNWLCENLALPLFKEESDGSLVVNEAGRELIGGPVPQSLLTCVRRALGDASNNEQLAQAAASARAGTAQSAQGPGGQQVLFMPLVPGRAAALVAPAPFAEISRLQQRASVTDRTAGVSHELANALGAIAGWARVARTGERVPEALELIERSAEGAWSVARQFLFDAGGKDSSGADHVTDLSALVLEASRLIAPKASMNDVQVTCDVIPDLLAPADRGTLWTVVWNLVTNAVEAMPDGGTLTLVLESLQGQLCLTVRDTGEGMPEAVQRRMFDPYFTTKSTGSGIGLSLVRKTIETLNGNIVVHSTPGVGTRIEVWLPIAEEEVTRPRGSKRSSGVFVTDQLEGRYLVVDDDAILREMLSTALEMRGATVTSVASAEDALVQKEPFDVVIVDLLLSGWRGDRLLAELRDKGIAQQAVLVSGTELPSEIAAGGKPDAVLRKPFDLDALFERLLELQTSRSGRHSNSA